MSNIHKSRLINTTPCPESCPQLLPTAQAGRRQRHPQPLEGLLFPGDSSVTGCSQQLPRASCCNPAALRLVLFVPGHLLASQGERMSSDCPAYTLKGTATKALLAYLQGNKGGNPGTTRGSSEPKTNHVNLQYSCSNFFIFSPLDSFPVGAQSTVYISPETTSRSSFPDSSKPHFLKQPKHDKKKRKPRSGRDDLGATPGII